MSIPLAPAPCAAQELSRFDKCLKSKGVRGTLRLMLRETFSHAFLTLYHVSLDFTRFLGSLLQSRSALASENLFLRKQLALPRTSSSASRGHRCHPADDGIARDTV